VLSENKVARALEEYSKSLGMDLFGVAKVSQTKEYISKQGGEYVGSFPFAICIGIRLIDNVIDQLENHQDPIAIATYRGVYDAANQTLDHAVLMIAKKIQEKGYKAYPNPASSMLNNDNIEAVFSHKVAGNLAGLGWIGKNCLLITPEYGPRVRLASILTDAPLEPGSPIPNRCGTCTRCADVCPSKALYGITFSSDDPREVRMDASLCNDYTTERMDVFGNANCGLCVYVCPWGRPKLSQPK